MFFKKKKKSWYDMVKPKVTHTINTVLYVNVGLKILARVATKSLVFLFDWDEATKTVWLRLGEDR